jgi:hypothetical protein
MGKLTLFIVFHSTKQNTVTHPKPFSTSLAEASLAKVVFGAAVVFFVVLVVLPSWITVSDVLRHPVRRSTRPIHNPSLLRCP